MEKASVGVKKPNHMVVHVVLPRRRRSLKKGVLERLGWLALGAGLWRLVLIASA